jgi:hypothetical protein
MGAGSLWFIFAVRLKAYPDTNLLGVWGAGQACLAEAWRMHRSFPFAALTVRMTSRGDGVRDR